MWLFAMNKVTAVLEFPDPDQVLTFGEWCLLNKISTRTGRRILKLPEPDRPAVVRLSANRMGITRRANRRWQESRECTPPHGRFGRGELKEAQPPS